MSKYSSKSTNVYIMFLSKTTSNCPKCIFRVVKHHDFYIPCVLEQKKSKTKHTAAGIPTWSPTVVLICRSTAYVWQSGRDAQFSADCGRMCLFPRMLNLYPLLAPRLRL
jgi:hypothetical protein